MTKKKKFYSKVLNFKTKFKIDDFISKFALENSNIGVWDYNAIDNTVVHSVEAKRILGIEEVEDDKVTYNWHEKIHPEDVNKVTEKVVQHFNGETQTYTSEHRILSKDGSYKWVKDTGKVVERDKDGNHIRVIGTLIDINEQKKQEANIESKQLIIENQNEKLKNFSLMVIHNLKLHTANFDSLLDFYDDAKDELEKDELIAILKTVNKSLTKTITSLRGIVTVSTSKNDNIECIHLKSFIDNAIGLLTIKIKKTNSIIHNEVDSEIFLDFNADYMGSIIQNLLSNAIKYKHPSRSPIIHIESKVTEEHIILTFKDNGLGIDLDKFGNEIFELYRTFHQNEDAEGVGLYLTKNQIEAFNGSIEVDSTVNVGSTFTIKLPNKKV
ncbi:sensor histidine kinase [Oceanihabitans sediminis]|uniref:sensor histidine kinase n=1 Tax=Oceanihabitans sediminis TaxID=1812012 RepID=UPI003A90B112